MQQVLFSYPDTNCFPVALFLYKNRYISQTYIIIALNIFVVIIVMILYYTNNLVRVFVSLFASFSPSFSNVTIFSTQFISLLI